MVAHLLEKISSIRILDPAVGSGAFLMSALHKLSLALRKLGQEGEMRDVGPPTDRLASPDGPPSSNFHLTEFRRKLHLIQNCLFGVDIQPIACHIAKLRIFISLVIEQQSTADMQSNYNIEPLPNLESKIIAANTLVGVQYLVQSNLDVGDLDNQNIQDIKNSLRRVRAEYFLPSSREEKDRLARQDQQLRLRLREELQALWQDRNREIVKISQWNPYDQSSSADWFDPEWMLGIHSGFGVVIGNPPYVRADGVNSYPDLRRVIKDSNQYVTLSGRWDLYIPFLERGHNLLASSGILSYIIPDAYCRSKYACLSRKWLLGNSRMRQIDFYEAIKLFDAGVKNISFVAQKMDGGNSAPVRFKHYPCFGDRTKLSTACQNRAGEALFLSDPEANTFDFSKLRNVLPIKFLGYISYGLRANSVRHSPTKFVTSDMTSECKSASHTKAFVEGKHIAKWFVKRRIFLEWGTERAPSMFYTRTFDELYDVQEKLIIKRLSGLEPKVCYDDEQTRFNQTCIGFVPWECLRNVRNRSIDKSARYMDQPPLAHAMPREECEKISERFDIRFVLGVLNSRMAHAYMIAHRISNQDLCPNLWKELPIPDASPNEQSEVASIVSKILQTPDSGNLAEMERLLNVAVYSLYGLSSAEIEQVENFLPGNDPSENIEDIVA